jgi:hypothetical protein
VPRSRRDNRAWQTAERCRRLVRRPHQGPETAILEGNEDVAADHQRDTRHLAGRGFCGRRRRRVRPTAWHPAHSAPDRGGPPADRLPGCVRRCSRLSCVHSGDRPCPGDGDPGVESRRACVSGPVCAGYCRAGLRGRPGWATLPSGPRRRGQLSRLSADAILRTVESSWPGICWVSWTSSQRLVLERGVQRLPLAAVGA